MGTSHYPSHSIEICSSSARYTGLVPIRCMLKQLYGIGSTASVHPDCGRLRQRMNWLYHNELLALAVTTPIDSDICQWW